MYMELDQIQCKFPKISNGGCASTIVTQREKMDDDDEEVDNRRRSNPNNGASADPGGGAVGLYSWPASRIVRVSRATGGKDRHSKVLTSKGLRDRRVRLSVNTAIEFYDLQDRLGYDQPSKAVEWLLTAAATSIAELPPMNPPFLLANRPPEEENMSAASTGADQRIITLDSVTDRGCGSRNRGGGSRNRGGAQKEAKSSSSSETSKGSGLSISRSENRVRAREKAKERENENSSYVSSFTELLNGGGLNYINGGGGGGGMEDPVCCDQRAINNENSEHQSNFFPKFPLDYFSSGLSLPPATASPAPHLFSAAADHHPEVQPFSFASDNLVSANNRGTLQSNFSSSAPPSLHYHPSFFSGGNHRHLLPGFDGRLQVYESGDGERNDGRQSGPKRREKP